MNIGFYSSDLETLVALQKIAEKHNCAIYFGFNSSSNSEMNYELLGNEGVYENVIEILKDNESSFRNINYSFDRVWFELYERKKDKSHIMAYCKENLYFELDKSDIDTYELDSDTIGYLEDFLNDREDEGIYSYSDSPTIICGFGNEETEKDYGVYMSIMALEYFADLVCDYLGEEKISKVY